jgi:hypothetical protein
MGHGVREETKDTQIYFVTTGYLVQLLAHSPMALRSITHLIVDEVHERSVDGDLLCWLTKRYMQSNLSIKVLLMSATLHTQLYQSYFANIDMFSSANDLPQCLSVGVRRFPAEIHYVNELINDLSLSARTKSSCHLLKNSCDKMRTVTEVPTDLVKAQYNVAIELIRVKAQLGTGVLVFVSGLADIIELQARFEDMPRYRCVAIHSEIPFEEQEAALQPAGESEIKVVIATNAAESSVTLPDLDLVICLGTHKAINYRPGDFLRSTLSNTWISKSSAIQRAGRTGRVRPGVVYRLYTQEVFDQFDAHQQAEIHRKPLHEIVLTLKSIFQDTEDATDVRDILGQLLEPPDLSHIQDCFDMLFQCELLLFIGSHVFVVFSYLFICPASMLNQPTSDSKLTSHGSFAGRLPVDLSLTKLIIFGLSLGLGAEAVILAGALSQPKTIFRIASPIIHSDPSEYNEIVRMTFQGMLHFDNGLYSEPLMMLQIFLSWRKLNNSSIADKKSFCERYGIVATRLRNFVSSTQNLLKSVNGCKGHASVELTFDQLDENFTVGNINKLRLVLLWALEFNLLTTSSVGKITPSNANVVKVGKGRLLTKEHFDDAFPAPFHNFSIEDSGKLIYLLPAFFPALQDVPFMLKDLYVKIRDSQQDCNELVEGITIVRYSTTSVSQHQQRNANYQHQKESRLVYRAFIIISQKHMQRGSSLMDYVQVLQNRQQASPVEMVLDDNLFECIVFSFLISGDEPAGLLTKQLQDCETGSKFSITITDGKETKFLAINFVPIPSVLRSLYPNYLLQNDFELADKVTKAIRKPQKLQDCFQKIKFFEDTLPVSNNKLNDLNENHTFHLPKMPSLFVDLLPNMRLFNAYSLGYKRK